MADTVTVATLPAIEHASRSDPGKDPDKQTNEDACGYRETRLGHLAIVCDGMGGHLYGKEASEAALATMFEVFESAADASSPRDVLRQAIERANERVFAMAPGARKSRPGSTVVALLLHAAGTEIAHVGDSRCYFVHAGQIKQLTRDHSIVEQLVARGVITPEQAKKHPDANRITRALGSTEAVDVEIESTLPHVTGDTFILCSDGLSDLVEPDDILGLASEPPAQAAGRLVDLANARGGHDNVTVMIVRARESATAAQAGGVAPTVVQTEGGVARIGQTVVQTPGAELEVVVATPAPPAPRRRNWSLLVIGLLAGVGIAAAILALAAGLRPTKHRPVDASGFTHRPPVGTTSPEAVPIETPPVDTETIPQLHHPDGSLHP